MQTLHHDAHHIISHVIRENMPGQAVRNALESRVFSGNIYLVAIGKAAWTMAHAAHEVLGDTIKYGIVITKYGHTSGAIPGMEIIEAGHPLPDGNTLAGTHKALELARGLSAGDELVFLVSGGGSALFEQPLPGLSLDDITDISSQLLACGADIVEINTIRKRLSAVKGGKFAQLCAPARVFAVVLSDVLGDRLDSIASGPAAPDNSTAEEALAIARKYNLTLSESMQKYLSMETPKSLDNVETVITGSVRTLCSSAADSAAERGYTPHILCTEMNCEAREAGRLIAAIARHTGSTPPPGGEPHPGGEPRPFTRPCALIFGGETVVHLKGTGKGGRNQELALAAAQGIAGMENTLVFSLGSDGTDGPTDAAGGIVDGTTARQLTEKGFSIQRLLDNNDSYTGLAAVNSLIITGPTGTNVNDVTVILCR